MGRKKERVTDDKKAVHSSREEDMKEWKKRSVKER